MKIVYRTGAFELEADVDEKELMLLIGGLSAVLERVGSGSRVEEARDALMKTFLRNSEPEKVA